MFENIVRVIDSFRDDYRFLSNMYLCDVYIDGIHYPSVEHYYQSQKTDDINLRNKIISMEKAEYTKVFAKSLEIKHNWKEIKDSVMWEGLLSKFKNQYLFEKLKQTNDSVLIEGNQWHDNYWGNCICEKCINKEGKNKLGIMLMKIRNLIPLNPDILSFIDEHNENIKKYESNPDIFVERIEEVIKLKDKYSFLYPMDNLSYLEHVKFSDAIQNEDYYTCSNYIIFNKTVNQ